MHTETSHGSEVHTPWRVLRDRIGDASTPGIEADRDTGINYTDVGLSNNNYFIKFDKDFLER